MRNTLEGEKVKYLKRPVKFLKEYKLFGLALLTIIVGLILQFTGQKTAAHWVVSSIAILEVFPLLWDMWQNIRTGSYGIEILAITAIVASVLLGQYWAAIAVVVMLTGGKSLENYAQHRAKTELNELLKLAPHKAHVIRKG